MKKSHLSIIIFETIMLLLLSFGFIWQSKKIHDFRNDVLMLKDSIGYYQSKSIHPRDLPERNSDFPIVLKKLQEPELLTSDYKIFETHRIIHNWGRKINMVRVDCSRDSSINLIFKKFEFKDIFGIGDTILKTQVQKLDKKIWLEYKKRLATIDFSDLTLHSGGLDCPGQELVWEANIRFNNYGFWTPCYRAAQFSKACFFLMSQVNDPDAQRFFKRRMESGAW